jgi:hypothetical protein
MATLQFQMKKKNKKKGFRWSMCGTKDILEVYIFLTCIVSLYLYDPTPRKIDR